MRRVYRLTVEDDGVLYYPNGVTVNNRHLFRQGKLRTITVQNPIITPGLDSVVNDLAKQEYGKMPYEQQPNAYVATGFNPDTQFEKDGKMYSVYALQFYWIPLLL